MWVLIVTIILNGTTQTVEVKPFGEWMCAVMSHAIPKKEMTLDGNAITVVSAKCEKR